MADQISQEFSRLEREFRQACTSADWWGRFEAVLHVREGELQVVEHAAKRTVNLKPKAKHA